MWYLAVLTDGFQRCQSIPRQLHSRDFTTSNLYSNTTGELFLGDVMKVMCKNRQDRSLLVRCSLDGWEEMPTSGQEYTLNTMCESEFRWILEFRTAPCTRYGTFEVYPKYVGPLIVLYVPQARLPCTFWYRQGFSNCRSLPCCAHANCGSHKQGRTKLFKLLLGLCEENSLHFKSIECQILHGR